MKRRVHFHKPTDNELRLADVLYEMADHLKNHARALYVGVTTDPETTKKRKRRKAKP